MTDIRRLADELGSDPLGRGYAALSDKDTATALNAPTRPAPEAVPTADIKRYLFTAGLWMDIKNSTAESAVAARDALNMFSRLHVQREDVATAVAQSLDALIADGLASEAHKADVLAMGANTRSRAEELDLLGSSMRVTSIDVARARRWYLQ